MIFNSIPFIIFFPIVVLIYYVLPVKIRYIWLFVCSYFFYFTQSASYVAFLLISTLTTYFAGIFLFKTESVKPKKLIVALSFIVNIGLMVFFKYTDFALGAVGSERRLSLVIPVGISFYSLMALSYVMDCYRGKMEPERNFIRYALYVSFFLTLLSGPINLARDLIPQLKCDNKPELQDIKLGLMRMLWGYFLKLVIAARLTILVDTAYANADGFSGGSLLLAAVSYLFMLYCDFEGYSQIAIGGAGLLGIHMKDNFSQPFYSESMGQLWHRWHISLSTWFKEYLYFPLGGNRKGTVRKYINLMIVMFVSGLWHGANTTFFVWGILNGIFLVGGNLLINKRNKLWEKSGLAPECELRKILQRIGVYILYGFSMIFFANDSLANAIIVVKGIFTRFSLSALIHGEMFSLGLGKLNLLYVLLLAVFVLIADGFCYRNKCNITGFITKLPTWARWTLYLGLVTMIVFSANLTGQEFIYSRM